MTHSRMILPLLAALAIPSGAALASSDEAWEEFRAAVRDSCRALVEAPEGTDVAIEVNPYGSEDFGAALIEVRTAEAPDTPDRMVCIYDKQGHEAQLTAPFDPVAAPVPKPVPAPERPVARPGADQG